MLYENYDDRNGREEQEGYADGEYDEDDDFEDRYIDIYSYVPEDPADQSRTTRTAAKRASARERGNREEHRILTAGTMIPIVIFTVSLCAGLLIGAAITAPTVKVSADAWDDVEMTEEEYAGSFYREEVSEQSGSEELPFDAGIVAKAFNECKNEDKIGWLYYEDICDYPILYNGSNTYYLNHTCDGEYSSNGAIFCDAASTEPYFSDYTLIHGHHLRNDLMFTRLVNLKDPEYFSKNRYFYIYDQSSFRRYRVIAVTLVNGQKELIPGSFKDGNEKKRYVKSLAERSMYDCDYSDEELGSIVTLHTCDYTFKNSHMLVVGAEEKTKK